MLEIVKKFMPKNYYSWINFFFRIWGLLPPKDTNKRIVYFLLTFPNLFLCVYLLNFLEFYVLVRDFYKDFTRTLVNTFMAVAGSLVTTRVTYWIFFKHQFLAVQSIVERDTFDFRCFSIRSINYNDVIEVAKRKAHVLNYEDLKKLWRNTEMVLDEGRNRVEVYQEETMELTRLLCYIYTISFNFFSTFMHSVTYTSAECHDKFIEASNTSYAVWEYSNMVALQFDAPFFERHGWIMDFYQLYSYIVRMFIYIPLLTITTTTVMHITAQVKIVGKGFSCVDEDIDPYQIPEMVMRIKEIRIVKCITELQEIYRSLNLLEEYISLQMLYHCGVLSIILCTCVYVIVMMNNIPELISVATFLMECLGEMFLFTYVCHTLSQELENLLIPVYALDWTGYPKRLKQNVLILINRLQRREVLTAGKIINLDLLFFVQMMQRTYSLYTLISNTTESK